MQSTHTAELPLQDIPLAARTVHIFPNMATSLLAPGPLVQQGCTLHMDSQECTIRCPHGQPIHCPINQQGLYLLPEQANSGQFAAATTQLAEQANLAGFAEATTDFAALVSHEDDYDVAEAEATTPTACAALTFQEDDNDVPQPSALPSWAAPSPIAALTAVEME
jgi:hypothetical protein